MKWTMRNTVGTNQVSNEFAILPIKAVGWMFVCNAMVGKRRTRVPPTEPAVGRLAVSAWEENI